MQKITSRDNSKLKLARKARDGRERDLVFVEGVRLVGEILRTGDVAIAEAFVSSGALADSRIAALASKLEARGAALSEIPDGIFDQIADTKSSQGIIALCRRPATSLSRLEPRAGDRLPVVVVLHEINNPSNLGAILRTVEAVDAGGVIVTRRSADPFSPKSLRASMGAAFRVPIATDVELAEAVEWGRENGFKPTAVDVAGATPHGSLDWVSPRLLVFGSEAHGFTSAELELVDETVVIPMENGVESLNLAVSCGILLYEAKRN